LNGAGTGGYRERRGNRVLCVRSVFGGVPGGRGYQRMPTGEAEVVAKEKGYGKDEQMRKRLELSEYVCDIDIK